MSEQFAADIEGLLRRALAPVEPPEISRRGWR